MEENQKLREPFVALTTWILLAVTILCHSVTPSAWADLIVTGVPATTSLAPQRTIIPIMLVTVANTAPNQSWVTPVIHVRRTGSVRNDNFGRLLLIREDGNIGYVGTQFDLNHEATVSGYALGGNESRTWELALQMNNDLGEYPDETVGFEVIGVEGLIFGIPNVVAVSGNFPIQGGTKVITTNNVAGDLNLRSSPLIVDANIMVSTPNQMLGGFSVNVIREPASLGFPGIYVTVESNFGNVRELTSVFVVNELGAVIAGPVDANIGEYSSATTGTLRFADPITLPVGTNQLFFKGRIGSSFIGAKLRLSINPSSIVATGLTYGWKLFSSQSGTVFGNTMTAYGPALTIEHNSTINVWQTIVAGTMATRVMSLQINALQSSEGIGLSGLSLQLATTNGARATDLSNCQLWLNGVTPLNMGANLVNPSADGIIYFTFDQRVTIPSGTVSNIELRCDISSQATGTYTWSIGGNNQGVGILSSITARMTIELFRNSATIYGSTNVSFPISIGAPIRTGETNSTYLTVAESPGYSYVLQWSTNLINWVTLLRHETAAGIQSSYIDESTGPMRFYRCIPSWPGALTVSSAPTQPANTLAVQGASRVPFTRVTFTASLADVTIHGVTMEKSGLAEDAVFAGIVLLDENGVQIGTAKTLNSNHQATVGEAFVVRAGTARTITISGNMATSLEGYAGQVVGLNVVGINTEATVSGTLPISGAYNTINSTLTIGSVAATISAFDPGVATNREIGTAGYRFSGVRITAGSTEKVRLWSIRWNQTGSALTNDLANVQVVVDGVAYPTTVSVDGTYFTALFGSGVLIDKGFSKDIYIRGDITGAGGAGRTVRFDILKETDLFLSGETYGFGLTPTGSDAGFTATSPWFMGHVTTIIKAP